MAKLIELTEAAKMLGISPDDLTEMRSRNEIFGYRDGSTWKFKTEEIERVAREKGLGGKKPSGGLGDFDDDLDDLVTADLDDAIDADVIAPPSTGDSDSILVSEEELGRSDENTASTIIGEADDLVLDDLEEADIASGSRVGGGGISDLDLLAADSNLNIASEPPPVPGKKGSTPAPSPKDSGHLLDDDDELKLQSDSGSLNLALGDSKLGGSRIELADDDKAASSGFGSAINLGLDEDDLVLGSSAGSDITSGSGDSGINLTNPADSGLSLEGADDLVMGSGIDSLELGEDDLQLDQDLAPLVADDDDNFQLTPATPGDDLESDSGSQVIPLDAEEFADADGFEEGGAGPLLEDASDFGTVTADDDEGFGGSARDIALGATTVVAATAAEPMHWGWNLLIFCVLGILGFTGILMIDLMNNMWSWQGTFALNSKLMDMILGLVGG